MEHTCFASQFSSQWFILGYKNFRKLYKYNIRKSEDGASGNLVCFRKSLLLKKKALCIIDNNLETVGLGVKKKGEEVLGYPTLCYPALFYCTIPCPVTAHPIPSHPVTPRHHSPSCPVQSHPCHLLTILSIGPLISGFLPPHPCPSPP